MNMSGSGVDELDPMEAIQEDVDSAVPVVPSLEPDEHGWVHIDHLGHGDHPIHSECPPPCYQVVLPEIDSEDGPPPRRSGPTS
ncbi:hypothetical protein [Amycolatopsis pretoriensis]|uniref:hypothetical protein n=1 Tax=Amycolatopsis pretoriensis TaxID=218821 RepID=UPI00115FF568|nr:hypothetical protein [Amycolatopsis pretoriensis]